MVLFRQESQRLTSFSLIFMFLSICLNEFLLFVCARLTLLVPSIAVLHAVPLRPNKLIKLSLFFGVGIED